MADSFGSIFDPKRNNFDALRLVAAFTVLLSHSYSLTGAKWEPVSYYLEQGYGGTLAVSAFFVISGFLIARSVQSHDMARYVAARFLRIMPGLFFVTLVETVLIAPLFYHGPIQQYFSNFALAHMRNIFVFGEDPAIAGVFTGLPYPYVNGSLWTLPVESLFYMLLPFLVLATGKRRWIVLAVFAASLAAEPLARWYGLDDQHFGGFLFRTVRLFAVTQLLSYFLAGVVAWLYRDRIPCNWGWLALCLLLLFAARDSMALPLTQKLCLPYAVLCIGLRGQVGTALKRRIGDLSYGVYLFSYPILNVVISLGRQQLSPEAVAAIAAPVTLAIAWVSWTLVERPALAFKTPRRPRPMAASAAPSASPG